MTDALMIETASQFSHTDAHALSEDRQLPALKCSLAKTRPSVTSCPHNTHFLDFPSSPPGATLIVSVAADGIS